MISVIIPCSGPGREKHLRTLLKILSKQTFKNFIVIVFETISDNIEYYSFKEIFGREPLSENNYKRNYLRTGKPEGDYNRSWNMNVGANLAKKIIDRYYIKNIRNYNERYQYLFMDCDLVFDENYLQAVNDYKHPWFVGWNELYNLNRETSDVIINRGYVEKKWPDMPGTGPSLYGAAGGITVVDRLFYENFWGGFNENYFGWGLEDNDGVCRAIDLLGKLPALPYKIMHLFHSTVNQHQLKTSRDVWWVTEHNPTEINKRLVIANLGQLSGPTLIDISDIKR